MRYQQGSADDMRQSVKDEFDRRQRILAAAEELYDSINPFAYEYPAWLHNFMLDLEDVIPVIEDWTAEPFMQLEELGH